MTRVRSPLGYLPPVIPGNPAWLGLLCVSPQGGSPRRPAGRSRQGARASRASRARGRARRRLPGSPVSDAGRGARSPSPPRRRDGRSRDGGTSRVFASMLGSRCSRQRAVLWGSVCASVRMSHAADRRRRRPTEDSSTRVGSREPVHVCLACDAADQAWRRPRRREHPGDLRLAPGIAAPALQC